MVVTTIDPVTGNKVTDLEHQPLMVEGDGVTAMKIYFESEDTGQKPCLLSQADINGWYGYGDPPFYA